MEIKTTRLRWVSAKSPDDIVLFLDSLRYKVEIKGGPVRDKNRWFLWFVLPEVEGLEFESRGIDL